MAKARLVAGPRSPDGSHSWVLDMKDPPKLDPETGLLEGEEESLRQMGEANTLRAMLDTLDVAGAVDYFNRLGKPEYLEPVFKAYPIYDYVRRFCENSSA